MPPIEFGNWVHVKALLKRVRTKDGYNRWVRQEELNPPIRAIFLGKRTLWDSKQEIETTYGMDGPDSWPYIYNENPIKGAIVCQKNRNPIKILFSDLERM